jgi:hypothetical protein
VNEINVSEHYQISQQETNKIPFFFFFKYSLLRGLSIVLKNMSKIKTM